MHKQLATMEVVTSNAAANGGKISDLEQEAYCRALGWALYYAFNGYAADNPRLPSSIEDLVSAGWLTCIPTNITNDEPVVMLTPSAGISPGNVVLELAPPAFYSLIGAVDNYQFVPLSFQLGVYGPLGCTETRMEALPENHWATKPAGLVAYYGTFTEPAADSLKKIVEHLAQLTQGEVKQ
jgi:hypothetical protein